MDESRARHLLLEQAEAVKARGARSLYLFGSTVHGTARPDSDVDPFIDYDPDGSFALVDLAGIKLFLEDRLGVPIDVTTRDSLHPALRGQHRPVGSASVLTLLTRPASPPTPRA